MTARVELLIYWRVYYGILSSSYLVEWSELSS